MLPNTFPSMLETVTDPYLSVDMKARAGLSNVRESKKSDDNLFATERVY
jgi:hypothetical protein